MTAPLDVSQTRLDDLVVVRLRGDVDMSNVAALQGALRRASGSAADAGGIVVDATAVEFLSVAGMTALTEAHSDCERTGLDFAVVTTQPAVLRSLQVIGLAGRLTVVPSLAATVRAGVPAGR